MTLILAYRQADFSNESEKVVKLSEELQSDITLNSARAHRAWSKASAG